MPRQETRNENPQYDDDGQHRQQVVIEADKCIGRQQRQCMRWFVPAQHALDAALKLEDNADARIELTEVVRHGGDVEIRPLGRGRPQAICNRCICAEVVVGRNNLLKKPKLGSV